MTYFQSSNNANKTAVVIDGKAYIIYGENVSKSYPAINLPDYFSQVESLPFDTKKAISIYHERQGAERARREEKAKLAAAAAYEERKNDILNLRKWRRGEVEAYIVNTYIRYNNDRNYSDFGHESELIFGEDAAREYYDSVKEETAPDENEQYFVTELLTAKRDEDALQITSIEDLYNFIFDNFDITDSYEYASSIEDKDFIFTMGVGSFNRPSIKNGYIESRRTSGFWGSSSYYGAQVTTADLGGDQYALSIEDLCDGSHHDELQLAVNEGLVTKSECEEYLSAGEMEFYFSEEESKDDE